MSIAYSFISPSLLPRLIVHFTCLINTLRPIAPLHTQQYPPQLLPYSLMFNSLLTYRPYLPCVRYELKKCLATNSTRSRPSIFLVPCPCLPVYFVRLAGLNGWSRVYCIQTHTETARHTRADTATAVAAIKAHAFMQ